MIKAIAIEHHDQSSYLIKLFSLLDPQSKNHFHGRGVVDPDSSFLDFTTPIKHNTTSTTTTTIPTTLFGVGCNKYHKALLLSSPRVQVNVFLSWIITPWSLHTLSLCGSPGLFRIQTAHIGISQVLEVQTCQAPPHLAGWAAQKLPLSFSLFKVSFGFTVRGMDGGHLVVVPQCRIHSSSIWLHERHEPN